MSGVRDLGGEQLAYLRCYPDLLKEIKLKDQFARMDVVRKDQNRLKVNHSWRA